MEKEQKRNKQISMSELRERKEKLRQELDELEGDIEGRITGVQKKLIGNLEPANLIRKYPFTSIGASLLTGLALGLIGKRRGSGDESASNVHFSRIVLDEVKKLAARKAVQAISDIIDQKLNQDSSSEK